MKILHFDDPVTASFWSRELESDLSPLFGQFDPFYLFEHLDPALDLTRFCVLGSKSLNKPFGLLDLPLLGLVGRLKDLSAVLLLLQIAVVVAIIEVDLFTLDLRNSIDEVVEKDPVVRDNDHGPRVVGQEIFKPDEGFEVEVIGRLVEEKKVRRLKKDFRKGDSHQPATAQFIGQPVEIPLPETQSIEDLLCLGLQAISSEEGISLMELSILLCQFLLSFRVVDRREFFLQDLHFVLKGGDR